MTSDAPEQQGHSPAGPPPAAIPPAESIQERIKRAYPWTVASHYERACDVQLAPQRRLQALLSCWRAALQISAMVLLQLHTQRPTHHPSLLRPLLDINAPNTERWMTLALALSRLTPHQAPNTPWWPALALAVTQLTQLRHRGTMVASALKSLRSRVETPSFKTNAEALDEHLSRHITLLEAALETLAPLEALTIWRRVDERTAMRLQGTSASLRTEVCSQNNVRKAMERHPIVAAWGAFAMSMNPWMIAPDKHHGDDDKLLLYQGHASQTALYAGVHQWQMTPTMARVVAERLRDMTLPRGDAHQERARQFTRRTLAGLTGNRLPAQGLRPRPDIDAALMAALETTEPASAALLLGTPGSGRCTQLCRLALHLLKDPQGPAPLLIVGGTGSLERRILEALGARDAEDLDELLTSWPHEQELVVLMDTPEHGPTLDEPFRALDRVALTLHQANEAAPTPFVKLLLSGNLGRWHLTLGQWRQRHDTPFFSHAFALAHFPDNDSEPDPARSTPPPFLTLPLLTDPQAAESYAWVSHALTRPCPTPWGQLDAATRLTLRSPLAARIYHMTFSGVARPPSISSEDTLWRLWCERTLDRDEPLAQSAQEVLRPATQGQHGGRIDQDALFDARRRWAQQTMHGHPELTDASQGPEERLTIAHILRPDAASGWALSWPALSGALARWAMRREAKTSGAESLSQWMTLPRSALRDEAIVMTAADLWRAGQAAALTSLCEPLHEAQTLLLVRALALAAPSHHEHLKMTWRADLEAFLRSLSDDKQDVIRTWLLWTLNPLLSTDPTRLNARRQLLELCAALTEQRLAQTPNNLRELRNLVEVYQQLATATERPDQQAQHWLERSRVMAQRQRTQEITRITDGKARRTKQSYLRDLTSSYRTLSPMLKRTLKHLDRPQQQRLSELSARYVKTGDRLARQNPSSAMAWFDKARVLDEYLLELNQDNENLSVWEPSASSSATKTKQTSTTLAQTMMTPGAAAHPPKTLRLSAGERHIMSRLSEVYRRMALLNKEHSPNKASTWLKARLALLGSLQEAEPDHIGHQRAMASTHNRLGELAETHQLQRARHHYTEALAIRQRLADATDHDPGILSDLSNAYHRMGRIERHQAPDIARAWFEKDLALCARLVSINPNHEIFVRNLAFAYYHLGQTERASDPARAREHFAKDVALTERLVADNPHDVELHRGLLRSYEALRLLSQDTTPEAARWTHRALKVALCVQQLQPEDPHANARLAALYTELLDFGEVSRTDDTELTGEHFGPDLRLHWARALVSLRRDARERHPDDPSALKRHAEASARLGRMLVNAATDVTRAAATDEAREHIALAISAYEAFNALPETLTPWHAIVTLYLCMADLCAHDRRQETSWLQRAIDVAQRGLEEQPYHSALNIAMVRVGDRLARLEPRTDGRWQRLALDARLRLVPLNPDPARFEASLHEALSGAQGSADSDEPPQRHWLRRTRETLELALASDRTNRDHQRHLAICNLLLSDLEADGDAQTALKLVNKAQARLARLAGMAPDDEVTALALTWCHARGVELNITRSPKKALDHSTRRVNALESLADADPDNETLMTLLADVSERHGELLRTLQPSRAQPWFDKALAIREQLGALMADADATTAPR